MSIINLTATGTRVVIIADVSFPNGIVIEEFGKDGDPVDSPDLVVAQAKKDLNGNVYRTYLQNMIEKTINVSENTDAARALGTLLDNNNQSSGGEIAGDTVTCTTIYPDGSTEILFDGTILSGTPQKKMNSDGEFQNRSFTFTFGATASTPATS